jgi:lipid-binding SYLF domain-containing protein
MNKLIRALAGLGAVLGLAFSTAGQAAAPSLADLELRVAAADEVLKDFNRIPEQAIPTQLLDRAYAVAVVPNVIKGGFIVSGSLGRGILTVRRPDGRWSNPAFVTLSNLGVGFQAGAQGSDLILVFKSPRGVENIARGKFTIGGSASASAGPVGRTAVAATDGEFKSEIYTYARSRGLFAGVSLDGGAITMDREANKVYYGGADGGSVSRILNEDSIPAPATARPFLETLASMAPALQWQRDGSYAGQQPAQEPAPPAGENKTYAIDDRGSPAPETMF